MKRETFTAKDGKVLSLAVWDETAAAPRGAVVIAHGMAEHILRYGRLAEFLNGNGYIVAGPDLRAHGETDKNALGLRGEGDLFENSVSDIGEIIAGIKKRYGVPVVLMGHSYGSFIAQSYLIKGAENLSGLILSGSALQKGLALTLGYSTAKRKIKHKADAPGGFFAKLTMHAYDKKTRDGLNGWLSRDDAEVGKYNTDPLCGFICSNGFYESFFKGLKAIAKNGFKDAPKDLPVFLISGSEDKVGADGKSVLKLVNRLTSTGLRPELKLYEGARHELLNETIRDETHADILEFLNDTV